MCFVAPTDNQNQIKGGDLPHTVVYASSGLHW